MLEGTPSKVLPRLLEPRKLATHDAVFTGAIPGDQLTRLAAAVVSVSQLSAQLNFTVGDTGEKLMRGEVKGRVAVQCQRCLEPMDYPIQVEFCLAIVWDEAQAKSLPRALDPWIVAEQEADLYLILEEELLLALPVVAYHEKPCIDLSMMSAGDDSGDTPQRANNPFDVLKKLKKEQSAE